MIVEPRGVRRRLRRRARRERQLGPERAIVVTACGAHLLSCGHQVLVGLDESPRVRRRRCARCLTPGLNEVLARASTDGLLPFCEGCGASRSLAKVEGVPGVIAECRECHALVGEEPEDPVRVALLEMEREMERK